jgi:hypothetical protein
VRPQGLSPLRDTGHTWHRFVIRQAFAVGVHPRVFGFRPLATQRIAFFGSRVPLLHRTHDTLSRARPARPPVNAQTPRTVRPPAVPRRGPHRVGGFSGTLHARATAATLRDPS